MATSVIRSGFPMTLENDWSTWFTPVNGFTVNTMTLRHIDKNLYHIYCSGNFDTDAINPNAINKIGDVNLEVFNSKPLTGYAPAYISKSDGNLYPAVAVLTTSGEARIVSTTSQVCKNIFFQGLFVTREV